MTFRWYKALGPLLAVCMLAGLCSCGGRTPPAESTGTDNSAVTSGTTVADGTTASGGDSGETSPTGGSGGTQDGSTTKKGSAGKTDPTKKGETTAATTRTSTKTTVKDNSKRVKDLKGRTITIVAWWDATASGTEGYKQMRQVESMLNCKLVERKMSDYTALYASILAQQPLADIFCPRDVDVLNMANKGMLTPLSDLSNFNFEEEKWSKAMCRESTLNTKIYGMGQPQFRELLLYNKKMFQKNGWDDLYELQSQGKLDWTTLFNIMSKAAKTDAAGNVTQYGLVPTYDIGEFGYSMIHANGINAVTRKYNTKTMNYTLDSAAARTALSTLKTWVDKKGAVYDTNNYGWDTGRSVFSSGKAAMALADYDMFGRITADADFDIGAVLFPHGPDTKQDLVTYIATYSVIPAGVKNPNDVALAWDIRSDLGWKGIDSLVSSDEMPDPSVKATKQKFLKALDEGNYANDYGKDLSKAEIKDTFKKVAYGELTPAAAISAIGQKINGAINDFWK